MELITPPDKVSKTLMVQTSAKLRQTESLLLFLSPQEKFNLDSQKFQFGDIRHEIDFNFKGKKERIVENSDL